MESVAVRQSAIILERVKTLHPKLIDLSLGRIERLLDALGNPQDKLPPVIHVGGTNGKGSVVAFLKAILEASGKRVHAYTSPHLVKFHERIVLDGKAIDESKLSEILQKCEDVNDGAPITYFEITTAAALYAFSQSPADIVLLEVGLGGRFDATNVIKAPAATIVTSVDLDHQHFLGDTVEAIAREKAGIFKPRIPAIIGPQTSGAEATLRREAERHLARPFIAGEDWQFHTENGRLVYQDESALLDLPLPRLVGQHQVGNGATAIAALRQTNFDLAPDAFGSGLANAEWPARMQRLTQGPLAQAAGNSELWLDGGHNPAAGHALAMTVAELEDKVSAPLHLVVGMLETKDISGFLSPFKGLARSIEAVPISGHENALSPQLIAQAALEQGLKAGVAESPLAAIRRITRGGHSDSAHPNARILICGSLYLAGNILIDNA